MAVSRKKSKQIAKKTHRRKSVKKSRHSRKSVKKSRHPRKSVKKSRHSRKSVKKSRHSRKSVKKSKKSSGGGLLDKLKFWKTTTEPVAAAPAAAAPALAVLSVTAQQAKANFLSHYLEAEKASNQYVAQKALTNATLERAQKAKNAANAALMAAQANATKVAQNTADAIARRNAYTKAASNIAQTYKNHTLNLVKNV